MKRVLLTLALMASMALAQQAVTITHVAGNAGEGLRLAREYAAAYMAMNPHTINGQEYNVTVNIVPGPESATERFGLYLQYFQARSTEVDLMEIDVIWPGDLAEHLANLYDFEGFAEAVEGHFPAIVENNTVDGALVGMPLYTDAGLLYYRTDLLEEYGFDGPPMTWAELEDMARTIQDGQRAAGNRDFVGFVWQGNAYEGLTCDALEWIASNNGGTIISPDGVITVNNENAIEIVERAASWVGTISPSSVIGDQEEDARRTFQAGNAAFQRNWPYVFSLAQGEDSEVAGLVGVTALPAGDIEGGRPAATLGGWQLGVSRYSANPHVAAHFVLYLADFEQQKSNAIEGSFLPTIIALYEDEDVLASENAGWFGNLLPVFTNAVARPSTVTAPQYAQVSRLFFNAVHSVLTGSQDAETAFALLELDLEEITGLPTGTPQ